MTEEQTLSAMKAYMESLPVDDEPMTDEEIKACEEARADVAAGRTLTDAELYRSLGIPELAQVAI